LLYDGWNLIAESAGNDAPARSYTWGLDASGSMQGAGGVGGLLMVNAGSGGVHFPAYDLNGNVIGLVNAANGNISAKYEYGTFGEVFSSVGDMAKVNPFGFSTKYTDNETDLLYYGYRYYSPALGRWLSRDPIEEQGGLNLYGFVNNDPVNKWDVLGHRGAAPSPHVGIPPGHGINVPSSIPNMDEFKRAVKSYVASCIECGSASDFDCHTICDAFFGNVSTYVVIRCMSVCSECDVGRFIVKNQNKIRKN